MIQVVLASSLKSQDVISTNVTLTKFYLWTRQNPSEEQELIWGDLPSILNSNFESSKPTKVLVHGCTGNGKQQWVLDTRDNYLSIGTITKTAWCLKITEKVSFNIASKAS